ncbi:MAG: pilus assembly FimT family protein [Planctomycetota bacterium]|jgi:prepilin-type N-terminal cleavage/methylation domain-containing protein
MLTASWQIPADQIRTNHRTRHRAQQISTSGFSLLELVLVLAIIATFTAIALPRYGAATARYRADAAARRIVADLNLARTMAYNSSRPKVVKFDLIRNQINIPEAKGLKRSSTSYVTDLSDDPYQAQLASAYFSGVPAVMFNIYGIPDSGGHVVVKVGDYYNVIVVDPDTGEVSVQ